METLLDAAVRFAVPEVIPGCENSQDDQDDDDERTKANGVDQHYTAQANPWIEKEADCHPRS